MKQVFGYYQLSWKTWAGFFLIIGFQTTHFKNKIKLIPTQHLRKFRSHFTCLSTPYAFHDFPPFWSEAQQFAEQGIQPSNGT